MNPKKAPDFDLVAGQILKQLQKRQYCLRGLVNKMLIHKQTLNRFGGTILFHHNNYVCLFIA